MTTGTEPTLTTEKRPVRSRAPKFTPKQRRMQTMVARLQVYMNTYVDQYAYMDYTDETFIDDVLYGLGIAIEPEKYRGASGFEQFKDDILSKRVGK